MKKLIELPKNLILTVGAVVWLLVNVYVGAIFFFAALIIESGLKMIHSEYTFDEIFRNAEFSIKTRMEYYRHNWDNFHFKNLRLPF